MSGCGLVFALFYRDYTSKIAYKSPPNKGNYYTITGVTQSHCGCSDLIVKGYRHHKISFRFYYGGGLYPPKKYVYNSLPGGNHADTLVYEPVTGSDFTVKFDQQDIEILFTIDSLIKNRSWKNGLVYAVKQHAYTGFREVNKQ